MNLMLPTIRLLRKASQIKIINVAREKEAINNHKSTLNFPKIGFSIQAGLPKRKLECLRYGKGIGFIKENEGEMEEGLFTFFAMVFRL